MIFDSCVINVTEIEDKKENPLGCIKVTDTSTAWAKVYFKGSTNLFWHFNPPLNTRLDEFVNPYSQLIYEANDVGRAGHPSRSVTEYFVSGFRDQCDSRSSYSSPGAAYVSIYNKLVTADSLIFAQLRTYDSGGVRIREVQCGAGWFVIALTQNAASRLGVAFKIEG